MGLFRNGYQQGIILLQVLAILNDFSGKKICLADKLLRKRKNLVLEVEDEVIGILAGFSAGDLKAGSFCDNGGHTGSLDGHIQHLYNTILSRIGTNVIGKSLALLVFCDGRHTGIEIGFVGCNALGTLQVN